MPDFNARDEVIVPDSSPRSRELQQVISKVWGLVEYSSLDSPNYDLAISLVHNAGIISSMHISTLPRDTDSFQRAVKADFVLFAEWWLGQWLHIAQQRHQSLIGMNALFNVAHGWYGLVPDV